MERRCYLNVTDVESEGSDGRVRVRVEVHEADARVGERYRITGSGPVRMSGQRDLVVTAIWVDGQPAHSAPPGSTIVCYVVGTAVHVLRPDQTFESEPRPAEGIAGRPDRSVLTPLRTLAYGRVLRNHGFHRRTSAFVRAAGSLEQILTLQRLPASNDEVVGLRWRLVVTGSAGGHQFERSLDFQSLTADSVIVAPYGPEERDEAFTRQAVALTELVLPVCDRLMDASEALHYGQRPWAREQVPALGWTNPPLPAMPNEHDA